MGEWVRWGLGGPGWGLGGGSGGVQVGLGGDGSPVLGGFMGTFV